LPVQPVLFTYRWKNRNPNFTGSLLSTTFELMTSWMNYMEVLELPVHYPTTLEQADARVFADNMQQIVSNGEPREEHLAAGCTRLFACLPACLPA
jgi:lysophosphatidylcholine acyltransferase/lyso-PAF acetyltransferase